MVATDRRRWFRFSLRSLFVVMGFMCVGVGWLASEYNIVRKRAIERLRIESTGGEFLDLIPMYSAAIIEGDWPGRYERPQIAIWRSLMGDRPVAGILLPSPCTDVEFAALQQLFPELKEVSWQVQPSNPAHQTGQRLQ